MTSFNYYGLIRPMVQIIWSRRLGDRKPAHGDHHFTKNGTWRPSPDRMVGPPIGADQRVRPYHKIILSILSIPVNF